MVSYVEFDKKVPEYAEVNEKVINLLKEDKIHLSVYLNFLQALNDHYQLTNVTLRKIAKLFKATTPTNVKTVLNSIANIEKYIFEFVGKTKNPQAYILSPYYKYMFGTKYANVPHVSNNTGYVKSIGSGLDALKLSEKYALFTLGLYKPDDLKNTQDLTQLNLNVLDEYVNIYF